MKQEWAHSTIALVLFAHDSLSHRGGVNGEPSLVDQVVYFFTDVMADSASIDKDNHIRTRFFDESNNLIEDKSLHHRIIWWECAQKRRL